MASDPSAERASEKLQSQLNAVQLWATEWKITLNEHKSQHITFTLRQGDCPPVRIGGGELPRANVVKYLGLHLDRRLTWAHHVNCKIKQSRLKFRSLYWLIGRGSSLNLKSKLAIFRACIVPISTYGIELWSSCCKSTFSRIESLYNRQLRSIVGAPWYIRGAALRRDLKIPSMTELALDVKTSYAGRLADHPNALANELPPSIRYTRLKRRDRFETL